MLQSKEARDRLRSRTEIENEREKRTEKETETEIGKETGTGTETGMRGETETGENRGGKMWHRTAGAKEVMSACGSLISILKFLCVKH